jgi:hypothetical protein
LKSSLVNDFSLSDTSVLLLQGFQSESEEEILENVTCEVDIIEPIPDCIGLSRDKWCKKEVTLINMEGNVVASGYIEFAKEWQTIDGRTTLGTENIGVVVCEVFNADSGVVTHSLRSWPIKRSMFQRISLYDHLRKYEAFEREKASRLGARRGHRKYNSTLRIPPIVHLKKRKDRLTELDSVNIVIPSGCCKRRCLSQFDAPLIYTLRHEMHHSDSKSKDSLRLGVHRHSYSIPGQSSKMCCLEGRLVCMQAWRKIYGVSKTDFYRYKQYAATGRRAQYHGGKGRRRTSDSKLQAIQTMKMLLELKADSMPHKTRNLKTGEKVVQKILPTGTKWKGILEVVNNVTPAPILLLMYLLVMAVSISSMFMDEVIEDDVFPMHLCTDSK